MSAAPVFTADLSVPREIETINVPPVAQAVRTKLSSYLNTRSATAVGWQEKSILMVTRFGQTSQLHRVRGPMQYREQLTFFSEPIRGISFPEGGAKRHLIISRDQGGSEFYQLYLLDLRDGSTRLLSDGESRYSGATWSPDGEQFAYSTTQRNGRNWDLHIQDLEGDVNPVFETMDGSWSVEDWSADGERLLISKYVSINESYLYELSIKSKKADPLAITASVSSIGAAKYGPSGEIYYTSDQNSEFRRLYRLDRVSGTSRVISGGQLWNVENFRLSPNKSVLLYSINEGGLSKLRALRVADFEEILLPKLPEGILMSFRFSPDSQSVALSINTSGSPTDIYHLDLETRQLVRWTQSEIAGLDRSQFVEPNLIKYRSFDDLDIPAFVYSPPGRGPHPVLISIHGGPESQYRPFFSATIQSYVKELGLVYIAPNVRGSAGYGKSYLKLDNGLLRENSVKDIGALLDWIETQGNLDKERVIVMGGSYGGYMVLASMVHYGSRLKAAVERVGISNFVTFLENTQPYRQDLRRAEYGDERIPDMRSFLTRISPLTHVDKMITPVMISQGANDPRVPLSESEQMVEGLRKSGAPFWYILANNEGHGFRKKANRDYNATATYQFLSEHISP